MHKIQKIHALIFVSTFKYLFSAHCGSFWLHKPKNKILPPKRSFKSILSLYCNLNLSKKSENLCTTISHFLASFWAISVLLRQVRTNDSHKRDSKVYIYYFLKHCIFKNSFCFNFPWNSYNSENELIFMGLDLELFTRDTVSLFSSVLQKRSL